MFRNVLLGLAVGAAAMASPALAGDVFGIWLRDTGASQIKVAPCEGGAICGSLVWLKPGIDTVANVGQTIFFDMKLNGPDMWSGSVFIPESGKTLPGRMTLSGNTLTTSACVLVMLCGSETWTRVN